MSPGQKKIALPCPVPCSSRPAGQTGQGKKKTFALQYRAPGQQDSPALMTVSDLELVHSYSRTFKIIIAII